MIELFAHNRIAYESAVAMLAETGKAAIVHPTGTGKSFIGFKLCEDNPNKTVCWLSPSEYIFKTQIENLKSSSNGYEPQNVKFNTYAKLMNMSEAEIAEISPDYIILDEFHRCGAEMWGQGVQKLLSTYPNVSILGLSATAIRYLDNQRDMADELFDGNIASEMTLGEAIVRGILNPPKYVLSVFSYQKDLEKYEKRVRRAKSKVIRDAAAEYLEALRRALDKADGLDEIFAKHMTDRTGKYIVFCANILNMQEMINKSREWFVKVDKHPHIYSAYSDDPETSKAFAEFKADDSKHLKLLYCIDMLNEGIHVDDIGGVILLRPTVSPIIYKQQIGRALSAGKKTNAVIFDIVLNIENLYSIGAIEKEIKIAMTYYHSLGRDSEIVNDSFKVVDEVRDCIALFDKLNDTLSASWDYMYDIAKQFYIEHGHLVVPKRYKTEEGYALGTWLMTQRRIRAGEQYGTLGADRIAKLDEIGMVWENRNDLSWQRYYAEAEKYYAEHGNLNINVNYMTSSCLNLGAWICRLRSYRKSGLFRAYLTPERIEAMDRIGMIWDVIDYLWEESFHEAMKYYRRHGHLNVPINYVSESGLKLGLWIQRQRGIKNGKSVGAPLTDEQIKRLESVGMVWDKKSDLAWRRGYEAAVEYREEYGNLDVPNSYRTKEGYKLGAWISDQREKSEKMSVERIRLLDDIGMIWIKPDSWEVRFALAKAYFEKHGNLNMPAGYTANGIWLNKWLNEQRQIYIGNRGKKQLSDEQIRWLEAIGMIWENKSELVKSAAWLKQFEKIKAYYDSYGDISISSDYLNGEGAKMLRWMTAQRKYYKSGKLSTEQIALLDSVGMVWKFTDTWENGFQHAKDYYETFGSLQVSLEYVCDDGYTLGHWISNQRSNYLYPDQYHKVTDEQAKLLESIGMIWKPLEERWEISFTIAQKYFIEHGDLLIPQKYKTDDGYCLGEWIASQRELKRKGKLEQAKIDRLDSIGMDWLTPMARVWENHFESCKRYYREHGDLRIPLSYVEEDGFQLGMWLWRIRTGKSKLKTTGENGNQIERLNSIGMVWNENIALIF